MDLASLKEFLAQVARGALPVDDAAARLAALPLQQIEEFARLDGERAVRMGAPEVVFGQGKTPAQIFGLVSRLTSLGQAVLVTRLSPEAAPQAEKAAPHGKHDPVSRTFFAPAPGLPRAPRGLVAVVCAGTTDIPVAEEAAVTATFIGAAVARIYDVGVSGLHRLLRRSQELREADALVVCAGMEGALPSVVGGLVPRPVIAVPTSVGYGASLGGIAALLSMLNSCAANVTVVNIDNGFSAGFSAALIARQSADARPLSGETPARSTAG
ncbi:MAG TPA: nickel pincer cofactor biosynthesis protein LarB [Myxococcales bacterium]|jgi:pyridinium-3,5-biscarboxylic acid mononucleotide synthase|nr:nickel pincer cofactor biosynthesis protein LarB [Myxococcales bacterium]